MKHTLVYDALGSLNSHWIAPIVSQYFDLVPYDPSVAYNDRTIFYTNTIGQSKLIGQGRRVIVDNLWERAKSYPDNCYVLTNNNWFWYNESLWAIHLGYNTYSPNRTYSKLALMPMRIQKPHRDLAVIELAKYLDEFVWSYVDKGRLLPNDADPVDWNSQRYFNPEWYNSTYFSIVAETYVDNVSVFITEKTFKPICFQHPFMIFGNPGTLARLHDLGFETFENLFDESYDSNTNRIQRLQLIKINVGMFCRTTYNKCTLEKIQHNYNHFFNQALVEQRILQEIINPLIDYVEA